MKKLILASSSPRRKELLQYFNFELEIIKPEVDETPEAFESFEDLTISLAKRKSSFVKNKIKSENHPILAADTIVVIDGEVLGKPKDKEDARKMLLKLSGRTHEVFTGVSIEFKGKTEAFSIKTEVEFKKLSKKELDDYISSKEPYDKAGAYALQGQGSFMVKSLNGSYSNVIGLPIEEVIEKLQKIDFLEGLK